MALPDPENRRHRRPGENADGSAGIDELLSSSVRDEPAVEGRMLTEIARSLEVPVDEHEQTFVTAQPMNALIEPGDEVLVPANTFFATAEAVSNACATPRFVDVDPETLLTTADHVRAVGRRHVRVKRRRGLDLQEVDDFYDAAAAGGRRY